MSVDFNDVANYYDSMYIDEAGYEKECRQVFELAQKYGKTNGKTLLDIACGTGEQARILAQHFQVTGLDLSQAMIDIARKKVPAAEFHVADMCDFDLKRQFDVVVNLYGSIGFAENVERMQAAIQAAKRHLLPGGLFILTPWATKETFQEGLFSVASERNGISFCRMEVLRRLSEDQIRVEMHHLIGQNLSVELREHEQTISLFSEAEYVSAIESQGFQIQERLSEQQFRMGAFVCTKPE